LGTEAVGCGFGRAALEVDRFFLTESALAESAAATLSRFAGVTEEGVAAESGSQGAESTWTGAGGLETVSGDEAPAPIPASGDACLSLQAESDARTARTARDETPLIISLQVEQNLCGCTPNAAPSS
jgi:hypothetical protein